MDFLKKYPAPGKFFFWWGDTGLELIPFRRSTGGSRSYVDGNDYNVSDHC